MRQSETIRSLIQVEVISADMMQLLNAWNCAKIKLQDIEYCNDLTVHMKIEANAYREFFCIAEKHGASIKLIGSSGIWNRITHVINRPVLAFFVLLIVFLCCFLPSRVFFISVEGNKNIPTNQILEAAEECGIVFGARRWEVRSEAMKNALLQKIPELQWAGINTLGCTAVIAVQEKAPAEVKQSQPFAVCNIVASRDGVVQDCTVLQGNPLCFVGQAVKAGQTLVSGYIDCGLVTKATQAEAAIRAITFRELEAIALKPNHVRGETIGKKTRYSLRIGKNIIKIDKDSGILDSTCAKIYEEVYAHLPGGFRLPVSIIKETFFYYDKQASFAFLTDNADWLNRFSEKHLLGTMISGQIISSQTEVDSTGDFSYLYGKYACIEMIGQVKYENTILKDDDYDG